MSGGVDSSVAAALLAEQGHDVIGLSMQLYDQTDPHRAFGSCCTLEDLYDARRVAAAISIPHYILNFEQQFDAHVVSNFVQEYTAGRTPLPCARCNSDLKFATLVDRAQGFGADHVATGHYARVERDAATGRYRLKRSLDPAKDQSYFLFSLTQEQLARAVFPIGDISKDAVRDHARRPQGRFPRPDPAYDDRRRRPTGPRRQPAAIPATCSPHLRGRQLAIVQVRPVADRGKHRLSRPVLRPSRGVAARDAPWRRRSHRRYPSAATDAGSCPQVRPHRARMHTQRIGDVVGRDAGLAESAGRLDALLQ